jgi:hypothetical protein
MRGRITRAERYPDFGELNLLPPGEIAYLVERHLQVCMHVV